MYLASEKRYSEMTYRRCGRSGILLPAISLGLWQNFGSVNVLENCTAMVKTAFDLGITHFDLANNYGPVPGSAEENFGRIMASDLAPYRDELIISSKAGFFMWNGPYGEWGSRKYLIASCDQSLKRMGLDYVDIFYHHRPDPNTPLEESMGALDTIVRSGRALYAGISNYPADVAKRAIAILRELGTPCLIHQPRYNMFDRKHEEQGLFEMLGEEGVGSISYSPLNQGMLTNRYLNGITGEHGPHAPCRFDHSGNSRQDPCTECPCGTPRPDACTDGNRLESAPSGTHLRADRRQLPGSDRGHRRLSETP